MSIRLFPRTLTVDGEMAWLAAEGYTTGTLNDRIFAYLNDLGYAGAISDRLRLYDEFGAGSVVALGTVSDLAIPEGRGIFSYDTSLFFTVAGTASYSITTNPDATNITIDSSTGIISIDTDSTGVLSAQSVVVTCTAGVSSDTQSFDLTVYSVTQFTTVDEAISDAATLANREAMAAEHWVDAETGFTGFADVSGFTTVQVASASALKTAVASACNGSPTDTIIELEWDGESETDGLYFFSTAELSADGGAEYGYTRPSAGNILIKPGSGYSPILSGNSSGDLFRLLGPNYIEFQNVDFGSSVKLETNGTYPLGGIYAFNDCSWTDCLVEFGLFSAAAKTVHVDGGSFDNCYGAIVGGWKYGRFWNCTSKQQRVVDFVGNRGLAISGATSRSWVAGNTVFDVSTAEPESGLHPDFFQIGAASDTLDKYESLIEFNVAHMNRPGDAYGTQGVFGDDSPNTVTCDWCVHSNLMLIGAYWAAALVDFDDNGSKQVTNNTFMRTGKANDDQATYPVVKSTRGVTGTGSFRVIDNYYNTSGALSTTGNVSNETYSGNVDVNPNATSGATYPPTVFTGNGSWTTNGFSRLTYDTGEAGQAANTAKALIAKHFEPASGWQVDAGCADPWAWPTVSDTLETYGPSITVADSITASSFFSSASNLDLTLSGLDLQENDIVLACIATADSADRNLSISTSGYTTEADVYQSGTRRTNLTVGWKRMGATPDTTVQFASTSASSSVAGLSFAVVIRGVDTTTAIDVTTTTASNSGTRIPDPASITPTTSGAEIFVVGMSSSQASPAETMSASYLSDVINVKLLQTTYSGSLLVGHVPWTSGAYDPAALTISGDDAGDSWGAVTLAFRPA